MKADGLAPLLAAQSTIDDEGQDRIERLRVYVFYFTLFEVSFWHACDDINECLAGERLNTESGSEWAATSM